MKWKIFNKTEFYDTLVEWWQGHEAFYGKILAIEQLPERIFVAIVDNEKVAAIPVYVSDADWCYIGFTTTNPYVNVKKLKGVLEFLHLVIEVKMRQEGFNTLLSTCNIRSLERVLDKSNYKFVEETNYYIKNI